MESGLNLAHEGNVKHNEDDNNRDSSSKDIIIVTFHFSQVNMGTARFSGSGVT